MTDENKPNEGSTPPPQPEPQPSVTADPGAVPVIESNDEERTMAMLAHLLAIVLGFLGPLIIWLIKKDESKFVDDQGKEALNFQLMLLIGYVIGVATSWLCIGFFIILAVVVIAIVFSIIGGLKAKEGAVYRYPFNLRMIK